jgi:hypothetical protein
MIKDFIPYEQALELKELGFDEPCFAIYAKSDEKIPFQYDKIVTDKNEFGIITFSQSFRFFREKYSLYSCIDTFTKELGSKKVYFTYEIRNPEQFELSEVYDTYEEAEFECLKKLIEVAKTN